MPGLTGQSLGRYHILEPLGEGGMAVVYRAYDTRLERDVAIKIITPSQEHSEKFLKRFEREARALAQLSHPNIIKVLDYGEQDSLPYLVMEYVPGGTLKSRLTGGAMPWGEAAQLLLPVARALYYAHDNKIIHRDVKPSNILINQSGEPMLSDFGIAKVLEAQETLDLTGTGVGIGTPEYMAPEQGLNQGVDHRADIYALGVVLYQLVTGRLPYTADTPMAIMLMKATEPLPRPTRFVPGLPARVEQILIKALARDPRNRYASAEQFAAALNELLNPPERVQPFLRSAYLIPGLLGVFIMLALVWAGIRILPGRMGDAETVPTPLPLTPTISSIGAPAGSSASDPTVTASLPEPAPISGDMRVWPIDQATLVYVPAGEFIMGASPEMQREMLGLCPGCDPDFITDQAPQRTVFLDSFWIDQTEVTIAQFQKFVEAQSYVTTTEKTGESLIYDFAGRRYVSRAGINWKKPAGEIIDLVQHASNPVTQVSWQDASAYCAWAGRRLPSEAEWEKAARGTDGNFFPWGNDIPDGSYLNFNLENRGVVPVKTYPGGISPYGGYDMAGNVWEWVNDWYMDTYDSSDTRNPEGPSERPSGDTGRVLRGGSWATEKPSELVYVMTTYRFYNSENLSSPVLGFRCGAAASPTQAEAVTSQATAETTAAQWSGILSVRMPTLNEIRAEVPVSLWVENQIEVSDMHQPGTDTYSGQAQQGQEYLFPIYWCAKTADLLAQNLEHIETIFSVDGEVIPAADVFQYNYDTNDGWSCHYHAVVLGGWSKDSQYTLEIRRVIAEDLSDGQSNYSAGEYSYQLDVAVP